MKKLFIITGAAIGGMMMAAFVFLQSSARSEDLFEENVEAFGYADPVFLPCERANWYEVCTYDEYVKNPENGFWELTGQTKSINGAKNIENKAS